MCWIYILKNIQTGKHYIGSTNNLDRRMRQHKSGLTRTTKILQTDELVYFECFDNIRDARIREKKLKSYKSSKYLEWLITKNAGR